MKKINIIKIGEFNNQEEKWIDELIIFLSRYFKRAVQNLKTIQIDMKGKQICANDALCLYPRDMQKEDLYLGITRHDMYTERSEKIRTNFVYGFGPRKTKMAIVSLARINSVNQLNKIATHELLHALGISHCKNKNCIMEEYSGTIKESTHLCRKCKKEFIKLN